MFLLNSDVSLEDCFFTWSSLLCCDNIKWRVLLSRALQSYEFITNIGIGLHRLAFHQTQKKQKCKGKAAVNMNFTSKQSQGCKTRIGQKSPSKSQKWLKCLSKGQQGQTKGRQRCKEGNLHKIAPITISQICNQNW